MRRWLAGWLLCALCPAQAAESLLITNQRAQTVVLLDADSGERQASWSVPGDPLGVAVSAAASLGFVSAPESAKFWVLQLRPPRTARSVALAGGPTAVVCNEAGDTVWVSLWYSREVVELRAPDWRVQRRLSFELAPAGLAYDPLRRRLYVAERDADRLHAIDLNAWRVVASVAVGRHPFGLALSHDGLKLASANVLSDTLSVVDTKTMVLQASVAVGDTPYAVAAGRLPMRWYVSNQGDDTLASVDADTGAVGYFSVGSYPESVAVSGDGRRLFVTNWDDGTVSVLSAAGGELLNTWRSGEGARAFGQFVWRH